MNQNNSEEPKRIKQLVDWELTLASDHVHSALRDLTGDHWTSTLPLLLDDFQQLLRDALDLQRELGDSDEHSDRSHWDLPSVTPHWQNQGFRDWVVLIELLRDAWLAVRANDSDRATRVAQTWFALPYPTFKRLALFAASKDDCIAADQWVEWLLSADAWWLWSANTGREVFRLFVLQGRHLLGGAKQRLEAAIMAGPPREMYRESLEEERWHELVSRSIWLHLAKLKSSGLALGAPAAARLEEFSTTHPLWQLAANESDEFSHWMSGTGDPDYQESRDVDFAPRKRHELVRWLIKPIPDNRPFYEDTWREVCQKHPLNCLFALNDLAEQKHWPVSRWDDALYSWSSEKKIRRMWRNTAAALQALPDNFIQEIAQSISSWIKAASKSISCHEPILLDLCHRVLALPLEAGSGSSIIRNGVETYDPVGSAINHPIGHVTQALINLWFKQNPNDHELLPTELKPIFTSLCDLQVERFRQGRVLLGSRLISFFRVDRSWTEQHLLPLFGWGNPIEAKAVWEGFLWSPRLYQPLMTAFKAQFLDSVNHYSDLGEHRQQYARFLTYAALGPTEGYSVEEFRSAFATLPREGLEESAQALSQALEGAADQHEDFWRNRIRPFWQNIWPKSRDLATPRIAESMAHLVIAAQGEFPAALATAQDWLQPIEHPDYIVHLLYQSSLSSKYSEEALRLLDAVIEDKQWAPRELGKCLDEIVQTTPNLKQDARYSRLREYSLRRGI